MAGNCATAAPQLPSHRTSRLNSTPQRRKTVYARLPNALDAAGRERPSCRVIMRADALIHEANTLRKNDIKNPHEPRANYATGPAKKFGSDARQSGIGNLADYAFFPSVRKQFGNPADSDQGRCCTALLSSSPDRCLHSYSLFVDAALLPHASGDPLQPRALSAPAMRANQSGSDARSFDLLLGRQD